jgi:hypothetical protein
LLLVCPALVEEREQLFGPIITCLLLLLLFSSLSGQHSTSHHLKRDCKPMDSRNEGCTPLELAAIGGLYPRFALRQLREGPSLLGGQTLPCTVLIVVNTDAAKLRETQKQKESWYSKEAKRSIRRGC